VGNAYRGTVSRGAKIGIAALVVVVVGAVILASLAWWTVRRGLPEYSGTQTLPGLSADVRVLRDEYAIPTIYASDAEDLFRAQGYTHAQDRFFEMDLRRKVVAGRTAELFGEDGVETDMFLRTLGWRDVAEQEVELLTPQVRRYYEAYAQGVNAWMTAHQGVDRGFGSAVLGLINSDYEPEPWTVADSLGWYMALAWDLSDNRSDEITRAVLTETLPMDRIEELYPPTDFERFGSILSAADIRASGLQRRSAPPELPSEAAGALSAAAEAMDSVPGYGTGGFGSNSWVVGPDLTAGGSALLANDTHLAPSVPGIFTQVHLRCAPVSNRCPFDVAGFSFSGAPGVFIGHNADIAWGLTSPYVDVVDLYLEKVVGDTYLTEDGPRPLVTRRETIEVAGGEPVEITVRETRHGPLISEASDDEEAVGQSAPVPPESPDRGDGYAVALRWIAREVTGAGNAIFAVNQASTWDDFTAAVELFAKPSQNIVYADRDGNIGHYLNGLVPVRRGYDGRWPVPGWTGEFDWEGFIPFVDLPHVLNPRAGFVATANDSIVDESYPYPLGEYRYSYRGDRIRDVLGADGAAADPTSSVALQLDDLNRNAEFIVPYLLDVEGLAGYYADGQDLLEGWDFRQPASSAPAAYFAAVWSRILQLTFHDEMPEDYRPAGRARWFEVVRNLLRDPENTYWDDVGTPEVETRGDILAEALRRGRDDVTGLLNKDPEMWEWGDLHPLELVQQPYGESGIGLLESIVNEGPFPTGGGGDVVWATSWDAAEGFTITNAPAQRMVVDFADLDSSLWVNLTGQSENPFSPHYTDQVELWQTGGTIPMPFSDERIAERAKDELVLTPGRQ
jgi:penicillin amidase